MCSSFIIKPADDLCILHSVSSHNITVNDRTDIQRTAKLLESNYGWLTMNLGLKKQFDWHKAEQFWAWSALTIHFFDENKVFW